MCIYIYSLCMYIYIYIWYIVYTVCIHSVYRYIYIYKRTLYLFVYLHLCVYVCVHTRHNSPLLRETNLARKLIQAWDLFRLIP